MTLVNLQNVTCTNSIENKCVFHVLFVNREFLRVMWALTILLPRKKKRNFVCLLPEFDHHSKYSIELQLLITSWLTNLWDVSGKFQAICFPCGCIIRKSRWEIYGCMSVWSKNQLPKSAGHTLLVSLNFCLVDGAKKHHVFPPWRNLFPIIISDKKGWFLWVNNYIFTHVFHLLSHW